ncbi:MAG: hypothetical protein HDT28_00030 [Clostridiales bacterium]|nr:hypothetical protein [Clostridiales bacterium]
MDNGKRSERLLSVFLFYLTQSIVFFTAYAAIKPLQEIPRHPRNDSSRGFTTLKHINVKVPCLRIPKWRRDINIVKTLLGCNK